MERAEEHLRADFRKTADRTYLILRGEHTELESYATHMLCVMEIPGLLRSTREYIDGTVRECVDITGKMPLTAFDGRMTGRLFAEILYGLLKLADALGGFLLSPDNLLIQPDFLYLTPGKGEIYACFTGFSRIPVREQLYDLCEYLIRQMREEDREGMILACRVRRAIQQDLPREKLFAELRCSEEPGEACMPEEALSEKESIRNPDEAERKEERRRNPDEAERKEERRRNPDKTERREIRQRNRKGKPERTGEQKVRMHHLPGGRNPDLVRACQIVLSGIFCFGTGYLIWYRRQLNLGWRGWAASAALIGAAVCLAVRAFSSGRGVGVIAAGRKPPEGTEAGCKDVSASGRVRKRTHRSVSGDPYAFKPAGRSGLPDLYAYEATGRSGLPDPYTYEPACRSDSPDSYAYELLNGEIPANRYSPDTLPASCSERELRRKDSTDSGSAEEGMTQLLNSPCEGAGREAALIPLRQDEFCRRIPLGHETKLIGKHEDVTDVVIREPSISRIHARVTWRSGNWFLRDLGSRNGTFADGRPLIGNEEIVLADGMIVAFSRLEYRVCLPKEDGGVLPG